MYWSSPVKYLVCNEIDEPKNLEKLLHKCTEANFLMSGSISSLLHFCALHDRPKTAAMLIDRGFDANIRNEYLETPLHWAVKSGAVNTCKTLICCGASVDVIDSDGNTPLHWACEEILYLPDIVKLLISKSSNCDYYREKNLDGLSPIECAALHGNSDAVKLLINAVKNDKLSNFGDAEKKSLFYLASQGEDALVLALVEKFLVD